MKEDIDNFLLSKPIMAKPVGRLGQSIKWVKRNRLISALSCCLMILLIIGSFAALNSLIKESVVEGARYVNEGKNQEALRSYESALRLLEFSLFSQNTKAAVLSGLGDAWSGMGEFEKAIGFYERALQIDANHVSALAGMGDVYFETGQYQNTISFYDKVILLSPEGRDNFYQRGKAYKEQGSYREALRDFHKAIQLAPNDQDTMKEISSLLSQMGLSEGDRVVVLREEGLNETEIGAISRLQR